MFWIGFACGAVLYLVCGVLAYGSTYGYYQRKYATLPDAAARHTEDRALALYMASLGPLGLCLAWVHCERFTYGLKWR